MRSHKAWIWMITVALALPAQADERAVRVEGRVPEAIRSAEGFDPAESVGLFVGIRTFKDSRFAEVPFAVDDAVDLAGKPVKAAGVARLQALLQAAGCAENCDSIGDLYPTGLTGDSNRQSGSICGDSGHARLQ